MSPLLLSLTMLVLRSIDRPHVQLERTIPVYGETYQVAFSRDGKDIALSDIYGLIVFASSTWSRKLTRHGLGGQVSPLNADFSFVFDSWNELYVVHKSGDVTRLQLPQSGPEIWSVATTFDGRLLGVTGSNCTRLYNVQTRALLLKSNWGKGSGGPLIPAGRYLALSMDAVRSDKDGAVYLYATSNPRKPSVIAFPGAIPWSLAYCVEKGLLYVGCYDGRIFLINLRDKKPRFLSRPQREPVTGLAVSRGGSLLAIGYKRDWKNRLGSNTLVVADGGTGRSLFTDHRNGGVQSLEFSPDGKTLAESDRDGYLRIFRVRR